jgi:hypothetical protein
VSKDSFELKPFYRKVDDFKLMASMNQGAKLWSVSFKLVESSIRPNYPEQSPEPTYKEGLWESTCLEVFEFDEKSTSYVEWNFSPSQDWAFFAFSEYRKKNKKFEARSPLSWSWSHESKQRNLDLKLPRCFEESTLQLTGVIDWGAKGIDYFALKHPTAKPDFHVKF